MASLLTVAARLPLGGAAAPLPWLLWLPRTDPSDCGLLLHAPRAAQISLRGYAAPVTTQACRGTPNPNPNPDPNPDPDPNPGPDPNPNLTLTLARLAEAFDAFDTDQSGELDYEEFVMMVSSRSPVDSDQVSHLVSR